MFLCLLVFLFPLHCQTVPLAAPAVSPANVQGGMYLGPAAQANRQGGKCVCSGGRCSCFPSSLQQFPLGPGGASFSQIAPPGVAADPTGGLSLGQASPALSVAPQGPPQAFGPTGGLQSFSPSGQVLQTLQPNGPAAFGSTAGETPGTPQGQPLEKVG